MSPSHKRLSKLPSIDVAVSGRLLLLRLSLFFLAGPGQCCHLVDKLISARTIQGECATCVLFLGPDEDDWWAGLGPRAAN